MKIEKTRAFFVNIILPVALFFTIVAPNLHAQAAPGWVTSTESAFPGRDWVVVTAEGASQSQAESNAMNALARAFRTDVTSLTQASRQFSQMVNNTEGKSNNSIAFNESRNFSQEIDVSTNVRGLIGVQIDVYRDNRGTVHVCARMNRRESAARYSGIIGENEAIIGKLLVPAVPSGTFEAYARLCFAHALAQVTDNFQNILEVLDPTAAGRRPGYGGAGAIRARMLEYASLITVGVAVNTEQQADKTLFTRAAASFFRDRGFKTDEQGGGDTVLSVNVRFEDLHQNVFSSRYFMDASLKNQGKATIFSFTENDRKAHTHSRAEARRLAVRAVEASLKEAKFAQEFDSWLNSFVD